MAGGSRRWAAATVLSLLASGSTGCLLNASDFYRGLAVGEGSSCAIAYDRLLRCWGGATSELNGVDAGMDFDPFTFSASGVGKVIDVDVTDNQGCAVGKNGELGCWGTTYNPPALTDVVEVRVARTAVFNIEAFSCARTGAGAVSCWKNRFTGTSHQQAPTDTGYEHLGMTIYGDQTGAAGYTIACAQKGGAVTACWGGAEAAALQVNGPTEPLQSFILRRGMACGLTTAGEIRCWSELAAASSIPLSGPFAKIAMTTTTVCGLRASGEISCHVQRPAATLQGTYWTHGGGGGHVEINMPAGEYWDLACGHDHCCALEAGGRVLCDDKVSDDSPYPVSPF